MALPISSSNAAIPTPQPNKMGIKKIATVTLVALTALAAFSKIAYDMGYLPFLASVNLPMALTIVGTVLAIGLAVLLAKYAIANCRTPQVEPVDFSALNAPVTAVFDFLATNEIKLSDEGKLEFGNITGLEPLVDTLEKELEIEKKLREKLRNGSEAYTETVLPNYLTANSSKERLLARLEHVLKQEYINAQLREKDKYMHADNHEQVVLNRLDYDILRFRNKHILLKHIETAITEHYEELIKESHTIQALKGKMKEIGEISRLKAAKVEDEHIPRVRSLIAITRVMKQEALSQITASTPIDEYIQGVSHPLNQEIVKLILNNNQRSYARFLLESYLKSSKTPIVESLKANSDEEWDETIRNFKEKFERNLPRIISPKNIELKTQETKQNSEFFRKWDAKIVTPLVQGWGDSAQVLGRGVCYANSIRLGLREQNQNDADVIDGLPCEITASDRVIQALYHRAHDMRRKASTVQSSAAASSSSTSPSTTEEFGTHILNDILKRVDSSKEGHRLARYHDINLSPRGIKSVINLLENDLVSNAPKIKESNGIVLVNLLLADSGHSIYLRIDPVENKFRLHDPNIGRVKFDSQAELMEFVEDLVNTLYTDMKGYEMLQMLPK